MQPVLMLQPLSEPTTDSVIAKNPSRCNICRRMVLAGIGFEEDTGMIPTTTQKFGRNRGWYDKAISDWQMGEYQWI